LLFDLIEPPKGDRKTVVCCAFDGRAGDNLVALMTKCVALCEQRIMRSEGKFQLSVIETLTGERRANSGASVCGFTG
jgi:hypothetical protein